MTNRRQFIKDAAASAGIVFTGCSLLNGTLEAQPGGSTKRRQVMVAGRRVKTIDIHAHVIVPEATALDGGKTSPNDASVMAPARASSAWTNGAPTCRPSASTPTGTRRIAMSPPKSIKIQNEKLAELCAKYPDRFVAFASVALQFPELAAQQLEDGVKKYNLRGAAIGGHVNGDELSAPKFDPVLEESRGTRLSGFHAPAGDP